MSAVVQILMCSLGTGLEETAIEEVEVDGITRLLGR